MVRIKFTASFFVNISSYFESNFLHPVLFGSGQTHGCCNLKEVAKP